MKKKILYKKIQFKKGGHLYNKLKKSSCLVVLLQRNVMFICADDQHIFRKIIYSHIVKSILQNTYPTNNSLGTNEENELKVKLKINGRKKTDVS